MIDHTTERELLEKATPGDARSVSALYAIAAMWLRSGDQLHPDHAAWLADRLDDLAGAIERESPDAIRSAVWATSGRRGRKGLDERDMMKRRLAVMLYAQLKGAINGHDELVSRVAADSLLTVDNVKDAWKKREKYFPDLFPVTK